MSVQTGRRRGHLALEFGGRPKAEVSGREREAAHEFAARNSVVEIHKLLACFCVWRRGDSRAAAWASGLNKFNCTRRTISISPAADKHERGHRGGMEITLISLD
jgi:hypothetical protein